MAPNDKSSNGVENDSNNNKSANGTTIATTNGTTNEEKPPAFPEWLTHKFFQKVLEEHYGKDYKVTKFQPLAAFGGGENYASDMLRVEIDLELKDGKEKSTSYILKMLPQNEVSAQMVLQMNLFPKEMDMYSDILPTFEKLYEEVGKKVKFGPDCYSITKEHGGEIIMEDLKNRKFKNVKRQDGLDIEHTHKVLEKLAQFHAASACWFEKNGPYQESFNSGFYNDSVKEIFEKMNEAMSKLYRECMKKYKDYEKYIDKMEKLQNNMIPILQKMMVIDYDNFNVLNHGDLWCNNIMFEHNEVDNSVKETYFIDYQLSKYGSPSQDLYYFLISSTNYDIKISKFDSFIKFYHDKLVENLKLLSYPKKFPTLREIHIDLLKDQFWGIGTATGVMTAVLLDPSKEASMESFLETNDEATNFKIKMFTNPRYIQHMEALLPFFDSRGLLDIDITD